MTIRALIATIRIRMTLFSLKAKLSALHHFSNRFYMKNQINDRRQFIPIIFAIAMTNILFFMSFKITASAETIEVTDYFPLESGITWTYLENDLNTVIRTVLPENEIVNENETKVIKQTGGEFTGAKVNYSSDIDGIYEHKEYSENVFIEGVGFQDITVLLTPPCKIANAIINIGDIVNSSGTVEYTFSSLGTYLLNYDSTVKFAKFEKVTVPFGTFQSIKMQNSLTISGFIYNQYFTVTATNTFWLGKYVGIVKSTAVSEGIQQTNELTDINFVPFLSADFSTDQQTCVSPCTLNFIDQSEGNISSWEWNFGDGDTSIDQNPSYVYDTPGSYSVSLTISGPGNSDIETKKDFIRIVSPGGDVNDDQKVDLIDIILVLQIMAKVEPQPVISEVSDINGDMKIGVQEAIYILHQISIDTK